jgi:DNA-binding response OmpR family regulator
MKTILYVEDNPDTANAVRIMLTHAGFDICTAPDGAHCLKLTEEKQFDLVLLDVMLPDMSGWEIYAKLKPQYRSKYAFLSAIPVSAERMDQLKKDGVSDYITKPFAKADLIARIQRILE